MVLRSERKIERALGFLRIAIITNAIVALIPPLLIFFLGRIDIVLLVLELLSIISLILIVVVKRAVEDYAFDTFMWSSILATIVGVIGGLILPGILVYLARVKIKEVFGKGRKKY